LKKGKENTEQREHNAENTGEDASDVHYPDNGDTNKEKKSDTDECESSPLVLLILYLYCHMGMSSPHTSSFLMKRRVTAGNVARKSAVI
jgi:hypothetical protein